MVNNGILVTQFRHYLKPWRPERFLAFSDVNFAWKSAAETETRVLMDRVKTRPSEADWLNVFTVPRYALAGAGEISVSGPVAGAEGAEGKVAAAEASGLSKLFGDITAFFRSVKLPVSDRLEFQLFALAPGQSGGFFPLARQRSESVGSGPAGGTIDAIVNLGPAAIGIRWCRERISILRAPLAELRELGDCAAHVDGLDLPFGRIQAEAVVGVFYDPAACLVDLDTTGASDAALVVYVKSWSDG